jgi:hypothetical protein
MTKRLSRRGSAASNATDPRVLKAGYGANAEKLGRAANRLKDVAAKKKQAQVANRYTYCELLAALNELTDEQLAAPVSIYDVLTHEVHHTSDLYLVSELPRQHQIAIVHLFSDDRPLIAIGAMRLDHSKPKDNSS